MANMPFLSYIYRNGLWISVPLFFIAGALLAYFILGIIRVLGQAHLLSVPLLEEQEIQFTEEGRIVLCTQGPQLSFRFAKLGYELIGQGIPVESRKIWPPRRTTGLSCHSGSKLKNTLYMNNVIFRVKTGAPASLIS